MRRAVRIAAVVLLVLVVLVGAAWLAVGPYATWRTRKALAGLEGMDARFSKVTVSVRDLSYEIRDLRIEKRAGEGKRLPFFSARRIRVGLLARELWHRHLVAHIDLDRPRLNLVQAGGDTEQAKELARPGGSAERAQRETARAPGQEPHEAPAVGKRLADLAPFLVDRVQVRDGEVVWIDAREPEKPALRFHRVEGTLENLATRPALSRGEPTVIAARGTLQETGDAWFFATADPLAKKLTFAGQGRVDHLALRDLGPLLAAKTDVAPTKGTLDVTFRFQCVNGELTGGIRPFIKGADTKAAKGGLGPKLKSFLADASLHIFKNDVQGQRAVATTIPIEGRLDAPDLQLVPTILGVVRNAFVRGLGDSLQGLPPPQAQKKQGVVEQARRALSPGRGGQPRAQPEGRR